ncbi:MAG: GNAT family N-acetyltransferase [Thermoanaerobaculia bacterium]
MRVIRVTLEGRLVRLEPLSFSHVPGLWEAGSDPAIWRLGLEPVESAEEMREYVARALQMQEQGTALPFATVLRADGRLVGSTRFGNIDRENRHVEIGWTWIAPRWQRTAVNTEAKLLMLGHAFEEWRCLRVELKTDVLNERSRSAILRLGAREEGIFRKHAVARSGRVRDSIFYSIIDEEWPSVREGLERKLAERP